MTDGYLDSHCHLQSPPLAQQVEVVLARAADAGVTRLLCCGTCEEDWPTVVDLARHDVVIPCLGLHPWWAASASPDWLARLTAQLDSGVGIVGEIGLDHAIRDRDDPAQEAAFAAQLDLARERELPVVVHCVRAWGRLVQLLREHPVPRGILLHAYAGSADLVPELAQLGCRFSFAGQTLEQRSKKARAALLVVPPDRLLTETDAPALLPPEPFRRSVVRDVDGRPYNEPANLPGIVAGLAELRGESAELLRERSWRVAGALFGETLR